MRFVQVSCALLFFMCSLSRSAAQDVSNKGKDFWVVYSGHIDGTTSRMALYITSDQNASGVVDINGSTIPFTVAANQVTTVQLTNTSSPSNAIAYNAQVEGIGQKKGIHITTDYPVAVYSHILNAARSGSTLVLPTHVLGKEYYVSSYKSTTAGTTRRSQFNVIATQDNTTVQITPTQADGSGIHPANVPFQVTLSKGDVYQYQSDEDLTGTHIKSVGTSGTGCQPIAVFSGSSFASMGCASANSGDNLYQQLFPFGAWGKVYYTAPFIYRSYDIFRILVQDPAEPVYVNGVALNPSTLIAGRFYEINTQGNNTARIITSNKPICVLQYMITQGCDGINSDPEMVVLNPVEQTLNDITVMSARRDLTPPNTNITSHYLNIIFKSNTFSSIRIDGAFPSAMPVSIPGTTYSYIQEDVTASTNVNPTHRITSDSGFICIAYGYGNVESYGYNAGANVKDLYQFVSLQNQYATVDFPATCRNSPFYFSMTFPYQPTKIKWLLTPIGYPDITINAPVYDSTYIVNGRTLYKYKLPNTYSVATTGNYQVKVIAENPTPDGCGIEQEITYNLQVYEPPVADFNFVSKGCTTDTVKFADQSNGYNRPVVQWSWNFGDNSTSSLKNPSHFYPLAKNYPVRLSVITDIGCISDTIEKKIPISLPPQAGFGMSTPLCADSTIRFTDASQSSGDPLAKWYWNFGDGSPPVTATTGTTRSHTYSSTGIYPITLKVETTAGCQSTEEIKNISIHPNPVASFSFGNACLPDGSMSFNNLSAIPGGSQNDLAFTWHFGDGGTSTAVSPVHWYASTGPFSVLLQARSVHGCTDTSVLQNAKVYAQPASVITVNATNACEDKTFLFNNTGAAPGAVVTEWSWDFGDGTTSSLKNPTKKYTSPGVYVVTSTIKSDIGCLSTIDTETITVNALPTSRFSLATTPCATKDVGFADASVPNEGNIQKWTWNMGDGTPDMVKSNNLPFNYVYPLPGTYFVKLVTETDKGCVSASLDTLITIHPQPVPGFAMSANCLIDPYSSFSDTSTIRSGLIASRIWNFGDPDATPSNPNTSTQINPKHKYAQAITYQVSLTVTSDKGCSASITQPFTINGSVPQSSFQVNGSVHCSNDTVWMTNYSSADVGKIVRLDIFWDDGNDPSLKTTDTNPFIGKRYAFKYPEFHAPATRDYTIRVVAYSGENCLKESAVTMRLHNTPDIVFDPLAPVCGNEMAFPITPASLNNNVGGSGIYSGKGITQGNLFHPSIAGAGLHTIRYTHTGDNSCINYREQAITVHPVPVVNAGPDKTILEGGSATLDGSGSGRNLSYLWSPVQWLSEATVPKPRTMATDDITYTLRVTSSDGCIAEDKVFVRVLKQPSVPNAFSPNGDGIHDRWEIKYLESYPGATVEIFNRYGQRVFQSKGYSQAWDGTFNGRPLPVGTYYYIVNPKNGRKQIAGFVDLVR